MADLSGVWRFDSSTVMTAPASGYLRANTSPATQLAVSATTKGGANVHADLVALTSGATLIAQEVSDATAAAKWQLTSAVVDNTTWVQLAVSVVAYAPAVQPPRPNQDLLVSGSAAAAHAPYATVAELQYHLNITNPTSLQTQGMQRCLDAAGQEIDWELGYDADNPAPSPVPPLLVEVNIERAVEHWRQSFSPFGVIAVGSESEPIVTARNTWFRHANKLRPLKMTYGVA
jgi:hypothetical protein